MEAVQRHAAERAQRFVGGRWRCWWRALAHRPVTPARPHAPQQDRQLRRRGRARGAGPRGDRLGHEHHARGRGGPTGPSGRPRACSSSLSRGTARPGARRRSTRGGRPPTIALRRPTLAGVAVAPGARDQHHVRAPALLGGHEPGVADHLAGEGLRPCQARPGRGRIRTTATRVPSSGRRRRRAPPRCGPSAKQGLGLRSCARAPRRTGAGRASSWRRAALGHHGRGDLAEPLPQRPLARLGEDHVGVEHRDAEQVLPSSGPAPQGSPGRRR